MSTAVNWVDVKARVIAGHIFNEAALDHLQLAAQQQPSDERWLVLGHAFLNADLGEHALRVLSQRRVDDRDGRLAQARALVQCSRWAEAKPLLQAAHREIQSDCEPLKVLAVVALREGQWRAAQHWITMARQNDPLYAETQWLSDEAERLAAAELKSTRPTEVRALLGAALSRRKIAFRLGVDSVWVRGASGRVLRSPIPHCENVPSRAWAEQRVDEWLLALA